MKDNENQENRAMSKNYFTHYCRARKKSNNPYTMLLNETIRDGELSFAALGLLLFVLSHADQWHQQPKHIWQQRKEGKAKIYTLFNELIEKGYATRMQLRVKSKNGKIITQRTGYAFFEVKATEEDIKREEEEFKLFYRNLNSWDPGKEDSRKADIYNKQEKRSNKVRETTTARVCATESLSLFDPSQPYLKGKDPDEIQRLKAFFNESTVPIKNPHAWIAQCVREGWHLKPLKSEKKALNERIAKWVQDQGFRDVEVGYNYLEFQRGPCSEPIFIKVDDANFMETVRKECQKRGVDLQKCPVLNEHAIRCTDTPFIDDR